MRKLLYNIHLWLSVPVGLVISLICLTGAILVFEKEIVRFNNPEYYTVSNADELPPLKPSELSGHITHALSDSMKIASLTYSGTENGTCIVGFENSRKQLSVNPYTGEVIGWIQPNTFFQDVRKLHRWLMDAPHQKGAQSAGKLVVGISTLLMVVILVSGLFLWFPRTRKALKARVTVSANKGWKRFWYDCHVSLGFYTLLLLLLMALTGLTWSFSWYRNAAYGLFGAETGNKQHTETVQRKPEKRAKPAFDYQIWDAAFTRLSVECPAYSQIKLEKSKAQASPFKRIGFRETTSLTFQTNEQGETELRAAGKPSASQNIRMAMYALHTGSWGGWPVKVIYLLAAFIGGTLPLTGYYLWIRKLINRNRKRTR